MRRWFVAAVALVAVGCNKPAPAPAATEQESADTDDKDDEDLAFDEGTLDSEQDDVPEQVRESEKVVTVAVAAARAKMDAENLAVSAAKAEVDAAKAELDSELAKIDALEKRLDERLGIGEIAEQRRKQRIGSLAKIVIAMSPQAAADMVARMPVEDAQDLILAMAQQNQRKASKLLSAMPGDRAAALGKRYLDHDPKTLVEDSKVAPTPKAAEPAKPGASGKPDEASEDGSEDDA